MLVGWSHDVNVHSSLMACVVQNTAAIISVLHDKHCLYYYISNISLLRIVVHIRVVPSLFTHKLISL